MFARKIIDEKGRLFAKINLIDFLAILFLLFLVPVFYFGYKIVTKKNEVVAPKREFIEIETNCWLVKLEPELLKIISIGDKELDENGQVIGEIVNLGQNGPYQYEFDIGEKQRIIRQDPLLKQIEARLKLKVEVKEDKLYYKDKVIRIGSPLELKTSNSILTAIPSEEYYKEEERIIDLNVTLKDLDEDLLKEISVGDKEVDENGDMIAEILSLGKTESSSAEFNLGGGNLVTGENSGKKQISTKMRLRCQVRSGSQLYFKGKKVEYNTPLELMTDKYEIRGLISEDYQVPRKEKWVSLRVKFSGVVPEFARIVQEGDIEKDAFENTIARVSSIISNEPALVTTIYQDKFITIRHPFDRDIVVYLDVLCVEKEGAYYFKEHLAKMGNNIVFSANSYSISGLIIGMK